MESQSQQLRQSDNSMDDTASSLSVTAPANNPPSTPLYSSSVEMGVDVVATMDSDPKTPVDAAHLSPEGNFSAPTYLV